MSEFEIITVTFSFIVGLGVAQMLTACIVAIRNRLNVPLNWLPFAWIVIVLLYSVEYWFALQMFNVLIGTWNWYWYGHFLYLAVTIFLAGGLILPTRSGGKAQAIASDFATHGRLALLALAAYLLGWTLPNAAMVGGLLNIPNIVNLVMAIGAIILFRYQNRKVQEVGTFVYLVVVVFLVIFVYAAPGSLEQGSA